MGKSARLQQFHLAEGATMTVGAAPRLHVEELTAGVADLKTVEPGRSPAARAPCRSAGRAGQLNSPAPMAIGGDALPYVMFFGVSLHMTPPSPEQRFWICRRRRTAEGCRRLPDVRYDGGSVFVRSKYGRGREMTIRSNP